MRVRALTPTGDMRFGQGQANLLINSPAAVAQCVLTRLKLWTTEWFLDTTAGTPWSTDVLGTGTTSRYDEAIRLRILRTIGVTGIVSYSSEVDRRTRALSVSATISTQFGGPIPLPPFTVTAPNNVLIANVRGRNVLGSSILGF